jgi:hypothetical protein
LRMLRFFLEKPQHTQLLILSELYLLLA